MENDAHLQTIVLGCLSDCQANLQGLAQSGALVGAVSKALALEAVPQSLRQLNAKLIDGDWSDLPRVELLSGSGMGGSIGAWASATQTIYLNSDWLLSASRDQVLAVLTEELGHCFDSLFNKIDTEGDEGELFSRILGREELSLSQILKIKSENDTVFLTLADGTVATAEAATLPGGGGDDTYVIDNAGDVITEAYGAGTDTVQSSINYILPANVEHLTLTGTENINGTGNLLLNFLLGNSGDNNLDGGQGTDTMAGGKGNDTYVVDSQGDVVEEEAAEGTDTIQSSISYALPENVENLIFTGIGNINGTGNALDNVLIGNAGVNILSGGKGDDIYFIGEGDTVIEDAAAGIDTVQSSVSHALEANVENLTLTGLGSINGTGNVLSNVLTGNAGANILDGGQGADSMAGGLGNDIYVIDNVGDVITELSDAGIDTVQSSVGHTLMANVENLTLTGIGNISGTGNALDNVLTGNAGINILSGGKGDDIYFIGEGDTVIEDAAAGIDTVQSSVSHALEANVENLTLTGLGSINGTGNVLSNVLTGNAGANILDGGQGADSMAGGLGNDIYVIDNVGDVITELSDAGTDTVQSSISFTLAANFENLTLTGLVNINGTGNALGNVLKGNASDNILDGGIGADSMAGGLGDDTYLVDNSGDVIAEALGAGTDTVQSSVGYALAENVENLTFTGTDNINGTGNALNNLLNGNRGANILDGGTGADSMAGGLGDDTYVIDNAGDVITEASDAGTDTVQSFISHILEANVENLTLIGTANVNGTGNAFDNFLTGNVGANTLDGGKGADSMAGGLGNDTYVIDNAADEITELSDAGTDTVQSFISHTLGENVENLTLRGQGSINGTGNELNNVIKGNPGANILDGGKGADSLAGDLGNDTYVIDNVGDLIIEVYGAGTDTVQSSINHTLAANVENLILTGTSNINGAGNALDNFINGNSGSNILDGGPGADSMAGGLGDDTYVIDNTGDVIIEASEAGNDTVQSSINHTLAANFEHLTLTGTGTINGTGNAFDNYITGNAGANILDGGTGADSMAGGLGNDTYVVDNAGDVITEALGAGTDTVQSSVTHTLAANVEYLLLTGSGNINGTGNELNNVLTGNAGVNILDGGIGADSMAGGLGNDIYVVDNAGDVITEAYGARTGIDIVQSSVTHALAANVENLTLTGFSNINATGNDLSNVLTGNAGANILDGGTGADSMAGGLGNDTYVIDNVGDVITEASDAGTDTVLSSINHTLAANFENLTLTGLVNINGTGNALGNVLKGNASDNILDGGIGADSMAGGLGDDTYIVDNSGDFIAEALGAGTDTVKSSVGYTLSENLENLVLTGIDNVNGTGNALNNVLNGNRAANILDGGTGADSLFGGGGDDTYLIDNVGDVITEASDAGTDTVQSSISHTLASNVENLTLTGLANINGTGNSLSNVLAGNAGANILDGGIGADSMAGDLGDDTYVIDNIGDVITEASQAGIDTVQSSINHTLAANVENLTLTGLGNINGTGNSLSNVLKGNAGGNILDGGTGADFMAGGLGDDTYVIDSLSDVITEASEGGTDTVQSSVNHALAANFENLTLTGLDNINGIGNSLSNVLKGNAGANILDGGTGGDSMAGGLGDDTYVIDSAGDVITEASEAGKDTVQSSISYALTANFENLILTGTANINGTGNAFDNFLTGNAGANILNGGIGADSMAGGLGNDTYVIDSAGDVITEASEAGTDTVQSSINYTLAANVENLTFMGQGNFNGTGNELNNVLTGNTGANVLDGALGKDLLTGLGGADTFCYTTLSNSLLSGYDRITDFTVGSDSIDGISSIASANIKKLGSVSSLTESAIQSVLTFTKFASNGASIFTFGTGYSVQTFLALNDSTAGFNASKDAIIEITGFTGNINNLSVI